MYQCPILKIETVSLEKTARMLGKSARQVRRYVATKQLRASGGGHGIPYEFAKRDLIAFRRRLAAGPFRSHDRWQGRIDGDTLARIAHASVLRQDNPGEFRHYVNAGFLDLWNIKVDRLPGIFRNCLPALATVPDSTRRWAARLADILNPLEMDFLAAMFIVRLNPSAGLTEYEAGALQSALDLMKRARPHLFYNAKTFRQSPEAWAGIADSVETECRAKYGGKFSGEAFAHYRERFFGPDRDQAWSVYAAHHPITQSVNRLIYAVHAGDVEYLRALIIPSMKHPPAFPEADEVRASLTALAKKIRALRERADRNPSANRVGQVLGLHYRVQGCRVARSIRDKLDRGDVIALCADYLQCDAPRVWKSRPTRKYRSAAD